jgi:hypothetical protein
MKNLLLVAVLLTIGSVLAWAWSDIPPESGVYLMITRVTTSETRSDDFVPDIDGGWDYGDNESGITENYGGQPFEYGRPVQIEVLLSPPPAGDAWESIMLQYHAGTNSLTSTNWTTLATRTDGLNEIEDIKGCHLGLVHTFPVGTLFMVRVHGTTTSGLATGNLDAQNITPKGDWLTWHNCEVVGFKLTGNKRPSY